MRNPNAIISSDYGPIIINVNDSVIARFISARGYWATEDIDPIKQLLNTQLSRTDQLVFYDVGANIGTHSLALAKTYGEKIKVRAFEAQRQIFNMLCGTIAINGLSNVYCHNNAISDVGGVDIEISLPDYGSHNNFGGLELIPPKNSDNQNMIKSGVEKIKSITIDDLNERVDFIKMDVEGMEDKALVGATKTIDSFRPICIIEALKTDLNFVLEFFRSRNYWGFFKAPDLIVLPSEYGVAIQGLDRIF